MLTRYANQPCADCGRGLTWIEIAFGKFGDPVCGACLRKRPDYNATPRPACEGCFRPVPHGERVCDECR